MNDQLPDVHGQLEPEHEPAARRYVVALGALDTAAEPSPLVASAAAAAAADAAKMVALWNGGAGDEPRGLFGRLALELGRMLPWRRRRVHGAMIAAINRNIETTRALIDATQTFQAHVIWYAQTIAGIAAHKGPTATAEGLEALQRALAVLGSDWMKHWESLGAREQRYEARMASLTKTYESVLEVANLAQQHAQSLQRAVEALSAARPAAASSTTQAAAAPAPVAAPEAPRLDAYKYLVFEDKYRGSREEIQRRLAEYVSLFDGATNVVDVGCGRGELLGLLKDRGIDARGIDINDEMVEACKARGLNAERVDALTFLGAQPDASLGGLIAIQVVEHLEPNYLMRLVDLAYQKLKPGAPLVLETINTACWAAFFDSYIRDFTHAHPLHPDTLRYLVQASGFARVDIRYLAPVADQDKLPYVKVIHERDATPTVVELVEGLNAHANRLNSQLFTYRDFAIVAHR